MGKILWVGGPKIIGILQVGGLIKIAILLVGGLISQVWSPPPLTFLNGIWTVRDRQHII